MPKIEGVKVLAKYSIVGLNRNKILRNARQFDGPTQSQITHRHCLCIFICMILCVVFISSWHHQQAQNLGFPHSPFRHLQSPPTQALLKQPKNNIKFVLKLDHLRLKQAHDKHSALMIYQLKAALQS